MQKITLNLWQSVLIAFFFSILVISDVRSASTSPTSDSVRNTLQISSPAFQNGGMIPAQYTCTREGNSPPLTFAHIPSGTKSLVLIMLDPDAPKRPFTHWVVWNIDPSIQKIDINHLPIHSLQGRNDSNGIGYTGPCPPTGIHRYYITIFALDQLLNLPVGTSKAVVEKEMQHHILAQGTLMGRYQQP